MTDIKFQSFGIINSYFNNLNQQKGRRALILSLGNCNLSIVAADILIYLIWQTYTTPESLLEEYGGYIVRTQEQIELATGCTDFSTNKKPMELLVEMGLVQKDYKSVGRRTRYRVNLDKVIELVETGLMELDKMLNEYTQRQADIKIQKAFNKAYKEMNIDWEHINNYVDDPTKENQEYLEERGITLPNMQLMHFVDIYWKEFYGEDYKWNQAELNKLSCDINGRATKFLTDEEKERLKEAIATIDEMDWQKEAHIATKICNRYKGYYDFKRNRK